MNEARWFIGFPEECKLIFFKNWSDKFKEILLEDLKEMGFARSN